MLIKKKNVEEELCNHDIRSDRTREERIFCFFCFFSCSTDERNEMVVSIGQSMDGRKENESRTPVEARQVLHTHEEEKRRTLEMKWNEEYHSPRFSAMRADENDFMIDSQGE